MSEFLAQEQIETKSLNDILKSYYLAHMNNSRYQFENKMELNDASTHQYAPNGNLSQTDLLIAQPGKTIHVITEGELERIAGVNPIYCAYHDPAKVYQLWPQLRVINANGIWYIGNDEPGAVDLIGCVARYCRGESVISHPTTSALLPAEVIHLRELLIEYNLDLLIPELDRSCRASSYYCTIL